MDKDSVAQWLLRHGFDYCVDDKIFYKYGPVADERMEITLGDKRFKALYDDSDDRKTSFTSQPYRLMSVSEDDKLLGAGFNTRAVKIVVYGHDSYSNTPEREAVERADTGQLQSLSADQGL